MSDLFHVEPDGIDRRSFVRRLFAMGAGIAASGALVRAASKLGPPKDAYEAWLKWYPVVVECQPRRQAIITNVTPSTVSISPPGPDGSTEIRGIGGRDGLRVGDRIDVEVLQPMEFPNPERLAEDLLNFQFEKYGGKEAIAAAMRDDVMYGAHGRIVVGKDLYARYEPLPIVASSRLIEPPGWNGKNLAEILGLNG